MLGAYRGTSSILLHKNTCKFPLLPWSARRARASSVVVRANFSTKLGRPSSTFRVSLTANNLPTRPTASATMSANIPRNLSTQARPAPPSSAAEGGGCTYRAAIDLLNTCQSNSATIEAIRKSGGKMNQFSIPEMQEYLRRLGYVPEDLNRLNVVHITGTKGKGSASAFVERIFREGMKEVGMLAEAAKDDSLETVDDEETALRGGIGLYTSPHLCAVRERIRVNGRPLPERLFAKYFFEVWEKLTEAVTESPSKDSEPPSSIPSFTSVATSATGDVSPLPMPTYPVYFRFLTLLAFHVFLKLDVRMTVLEVGVGGTYDSTNLVPRPLIAGVTALGLDHQILLGNTIEEIARNKGGIYKRGVKALSIEQENGKGEQQLREMAEERGAASFEIVPVNPALRDVKLGLRGKHQIINASLAVALAQGVLSSDDLPANLTALKGLQPGSPPFAKALRNARWPGRCQTVVDPRTPSTMWYLDGAHTVESLSCCGDWAFGPEGMRPQQGVKRVLIFNCTSGRSADALLTALLAAGQDALDARAHSAAKKRAGKDAQRAATNWFDRVIFCTNVTYRDGGFKGDLTSKAIDPDDLSALATQHAIAEAWAKISPPTPAGGDNNKVIVHVEPSIEDAIGRVRELQQQKGDDNGDDAAAVDVLVAGSLHLVGGVIEVAGLADVALSME